MSDDVFIGKGPLKKKAMFRTSRVIQQYCRVVQGTLFISHPRLWVELYIPRYHINQLVEATNHRIKCILMCRQSEKILCRYYGQQTIRASRHCYKVYNIMKNSFIGFINFLTIFTLP